MQLASVPSQIISPRECKPIISIVQDIVSGMYRLTKTHVRLNEKQLFNLMCPNPKFMGAPALPPSEIVGQAKKWTGRDIVSTILPEKVNVYHRYDNYDEDKTEEENRKNNAVVVIENGQLKEGIIAKGIYQDATKGIVHQVYNEYGPDETRQLFDNTQQLVCNWLVYDGFSVGVSDMVLSKATNENIKEDIHKNKVDVYDYIAKIHRGQFENNSTKNNQQLFEETVNTILNKAVKIGERSLKEIHEDSNRLINMIKSKAKGQGVNVSQMMACVGQQNVDGKRIPNGFDDRTLPHYTKYDDGPESRGFIESSFIMGLSPQEFYFAAMGGREGLIDTAVQSVTGETPIVIIEGGVSKYVRIGDWIDAYLDNYRNSVRHFEERRMELLDIDDKAEVYIPTTDYDGNVTWGQVTAMTRHDPGTELYRIKTSGGKSVIVTESKSLLIWQEDIAQFKEIPTPEIKVGDCVPVTANLCEPPIVKDPRVDPSWVAQRFNMGRFDLGDFGEMDQLLTASFEYINEMFKWIDGNSINTNDQKALDILGMLKTRIGMVSSNKNDVIIEKITSIEIIDAKDYPKVYDLTIPSTLNFGLANGLQVRDTSETGYIQRKLVKAMEDCKVNYDMTVRNANGNIIQFLYGEDGMDACKIEHHSIPYINMDTEKIIKEYGISPNAKEVAHILDPNLVKAVAKDKKFAEAMERHLKQLIEDREHVIVNMFKGANESRVLYPIGFMRMLKIASNMQNKAGDTIYSDLSPKHILESIDKLCKECQVTAQHPGNRLFAILCRVYLSPRKVLGQFKLNMSTFDYVVQQIKYRFFDSLAHPSEMVGVLSAQSLGEPISQLSTIYGTKVNIKNNKTMLSVTIGEFIDKLMDDNKDKLIDLGHGSQVMDLDSSMDYEIVGVSNDEKTSWRRISQISRHPANGDLVKVTTRSGRTTTCTLSHSFLKRTETGIDPIKGSDLKKGDRIPVAKYIPCPETKMFDIQIGNKKYKLTKDFGWFCGAYIADGHTSSATTTITKNIKEYQDNLRQIADDIFNINMTQTFVKAGSKKPQYLHGWDMSKYEGTMNHFHNVHLAKFFKENFGNNSHEKRIPGWVYGAPIDFVHGVIGGYIDGDGNVQCENNKTMVRTASVSEDLTQDFILLLTRAGIYASKCREQHKKEVDRNDLHTAQISRKYAQKIKDEIGLVVKIKADGLDEIIKYVDRDDAHAQPELIDKIPEMGNILATIGKGLEMDGQSRLYRRFINKESIGRRTLTEYNQRFEETLAQRKREMVDRYNEYSHIIDNLKNMMMESPRNIRDQIVLSPEDGASIAHIGRGKKNKGLGAPPRTGGLGQWTRAKYIGQNTLQKLIDYFEEENEIQYTESRKVIEEQVEPAMALVRKALAADVVWDEIIDLEIIKDDGTLVYDFTVPGNDSFMVDCGVLVHNTLNSVEWHTYVLIEEDGELKKIKIGDYIDRMIDKEIEPSKLEDHPKDTKLGWVNDRNIRILSCDESGQISWKLIEAVTRHPPINEDGTNKLVKVTTKSGREVIATKAKSFLKRIDNKIMPVRGDEVRVGDYLPVSTILPSDEYAFLIAPFKTPQEYVSQFYDNHLLSCDTLDIAENLQQVLTKHNINTAIQLRDSRYHIAINQDNAHVFAKVFGFPITIDMDMEDEVIPDIVTKQFGTIKIKRADIPEYIKRCKYAEDIEVFENITKENIFYDQVISVEEVESDHPYVYDFTVQDTRNFNIFNGLAIRDTFHLSGVSAASKAVRGVPRLNELLSVSKNIKAPIMKVYVDPKLSEDKNDVTRVMNSIRTIRFKDIVKVSRIYYDPDEFNTTIPEDRAFIDLYKEFASTAPLSNAPWLLRLELDRAKMHDFGLDMITLHHILDNFYEDRITVMFTDDNSDNLIMRIKLNPDAATGKDKDKDVEKDDLLTDLKALEHNIMETVKIRGIKNIERASMSNATSINYNSTTKQFEKVNEFIIYTDGSNMKEILAMKDIDASRTVTNDVNEVYDVLGVEAARQVLYNEIVDVLDNIQVNYRHIAILIDVMTNKGAILSVNRHGINRGDIGPLAKCSFEETTDKLIKAGIFAEFDKINGVAANVMLGQVAPAGTGDVEILIDESKLVNKVFMHPIEEEDEEGDLDDLCTEDALKLEIPIPVQTVQQTRKANNEIEIV
jgi:DNA-directed RNA polymerase beta' subunit